MFNLALKSAKASLAWLIKLLKAIGDKLKKGTKAVTNGIKEFFEELKKALDDVFPKWRKKITSRKFTELDIDELKKIRTLFNAGRTKNVAFTKGEIGGKKFHLKSRSGEPKGTPQNFDNFKTIDPENYHYKNGPLKRTFDSEQKQIEYLHNLFKNNKSVKGKIEIVSDLKICDNCIDVIKRFKKDFPNIEVEIVWVKIKLK